MQRTRYTAILLSAFIVTVYLAQLVYPPLSGLAFTAAAFLQAPWTIITSIFLHSSTDYMHLLNNLFFLALFGFMLEQVIGSRQFLALFLAAGVTANTAAFLYHPHTPVLGASGAVSGIVAALAVLRPHMMGLLWGVPAPMWLVLLGWLAINLLGFGSPGNIAFEAHVFGLLAGAAYGVWRREPREETEDEVDVDVDAWEEEYLQDTDIY